MKKPLPNMQVGQTLTLFEPKQSADPMRKAVQVVHSKPRMPLGLLDRKILNVWIKNMISTTPDDKGWYAIPMGQMIQDVGFNSNNRAELKKAALNLMSIVFDWDVLAPQGRRVTWKASVLFPNVEIGSDKMRYQVNEEMRPQLERPEIYALIDLNIMRSLRRAGSLGLYEHCARFENVGRTTAVPWQKLRDMILGESSGNKTFQEYKFFKSRVLVLCIAELNQETPFFIELIENKKGRQVETIQFQIRRKSTPESEETPDQQEVVGLLTTLGVPRSEAMKICRTRATDDIKAALAYTRRRMGNKSQPKLENPPAYFRAALAQGFSEPTASAPNEGSKQAATTKKVDIREEYLAKQLQEAQQYFKELDAEDQSKLIERYNAQQSIAMLRITGKRGSMAASTGFYSWLGLDTWGEPSPDQLVAFAGTLLASKAP